MTPKRRLIDMPGRLTVGGAPDGVMSLALADLAREAGPVLFIARNEARMNEVTETLQFFSPETACATFPAWDCLPYDRVSPNGEVLARRAAQLSFLSAHPPKGAFILVTTAHSALQRVPSRRVMGGEILALKAGAALDDDTLLRFLNANGYIRTGTVREAGEFALRGGIVDIFPSGTAEPVRLDFFGDVLESIRRFDPETQRSAGQLAELALVPAGEVFLDEGSIRRFRQAYTAQFGPAVNDPLYEAISAGRRHAGMEHWLPLFHESLETLFDYVPGSIVALDSEIEPLVETRLSLIGEYYEARRTAPHSSAERSAAYRALPPESLYLAKAEFDALIGARKSRFFSPLAMPESRDAVDLGGRMGRNFSPERQQDGVNVFEALKDHAGALSKAGKRVAIASWSPGARERLKLVLSDHAIEPLAEISNYPALLDLPKSATGLIVLNLEHGFETADLAIISEQDVLGERGFRSRRRQRRAENFLREATSLVCGDLVVHVDHGIGRYDGLHTLSVGGHPHDCLLILYQGGDKLYLPVENIDLLSRFGAEDQDVQLDRLGGTGWQARRAKAKSRIREMAAELLRIAAARQVKSAPGLRIPQGAFDEFCARFPYEETEDQDHAIAEVLEDLGKGRPMDRLVCGDVGFGKTEVALRAAFAEAMSGRQVAVVVPTTLLCRQHFETFSARFAGWPIKVRQLSRLVPAAAAAETRAGLTSGAVDVVIGTHALLAKTIAFRDLGLLIIDEEQHFGVKHKERLKQLKADVHVLTLSATPIPRTLQLAMSGVREMSLIATPPVDRLAVKTFVLPFDALTVREALLREHYRGGQSFYVVPRISDLEEAQRFLSDTAPEVKFRVAHGQMPAAALETVMNDFYDRRFDVLLSTSIIESGLDVPTANTLIVHRADMFGLAQLYQLRGRIGRSKTRAFAYLTVPIGRALTEAAEKRLKVLQSLDSLGAGFTLASHDLDIRGAGNLLGEEQSGHIKEVGIELYQAMLEDAVLQLRQGGRAEAPETGGWSPQIQLGLSVLIPDNYVADLDVRLGLYRRLGDLETRDEIDRFAAELIDRFGPLPKEVSQLLDVVELKGLCKHAAIDKLDAGPKGLILSFRNNAPPNPAGIIGWVQANASTAKLRADQKLVYFESDDDPAARLKMAKQLVGTLAGIANRAQAA